MTLIRPIETEAEQEAALELSTELFLRAARAMEALAVRTEAGELPDLPDAKKVASSLREYEGQLLKERERVLEKRKTIAGIDGDYAIDFDAVRAEIGGRLDRLRATGGAGAVSE